MRNIFNFLIGLLTFTTLSAQSDIIEKAEKYYQEQKYTEAIKTYQQAIKQFGDYEPAWFGLQNAYLRTEDLKSASQIPHPDLSDRLLWGQIRVFFYAGKFDTIPVMTFELTRKFPGSEYINDALDLAIIVTSADKDSASFKLYSQALLYNEILKYNEGVEHIRPLLAKQNIIAEYGYLLLSRLFLNKNETNQAVATLNEFTNKFRQSRLIPKAQYLLAVIYSELLRDSIAAKDIMENLINAYPDSPESFFARSRLLLIKPDNKTK